MNRLAPIALTALALLAAMPACGPAPTTSQPSAEPEQRRKSQQPGSGTPSTAKPGAADQPRALEWVKNLPAIVRVAITEQKDAGGAPTFTTVYEPSPPDVNVELAAPAGTPPFLVGAIELAWDLNIPGEAGVKRIGPTKLPISPVKVIAAPSDRSGTPFRILVPLDVKVVEPFFLAADPKARVGQAGVNIRFYDDKDQPIFAPNNTIPLSVGLQLVAK